VLSVVTLGSSSHHISMSWDFFLQHEEGFLLILPEGFNEEQNVTASSSLHGSVLELRDFKERHKTTTKDKWKLDLIEIAMFNTRCASELYLP
jgi:hypothetical protein